MAELDTPSTAPAIPSTAPALHLAILSTQLSTGHTRNSGQHLAGREPPARRLFWVWCLSTYKVCLQILRANPPPPVLTACVSASSCSQGRMSLRKARFCLTSQHKPVLARQDPNPEPTASLLSFPFSLPSSPPPPSPQRSLQCHSLGRNREQKLAVFQGNRLIIDAYGSQAPPHNCSKRSTLYPGNSPQE